MASETTRPGAATALPRTAAGIDTSGQQGTRQRGDLAIAGVIGLQLSDPLGAMQGIVQDFIRTGKISRAQVQNLSAAIETARGIAMQSQQLARLSVGRLRQSHEKLRLDIVVSQALAEHNAMFQRLGIQVQQQITPIQVILDAGLLSSLVDAAIEWSSVRQHRLDVSLKLESPQEHGVLSLLSTPLPEAPGHLSPAGGEFERLSWHLLTEIAATIGVHVRRSDSAGETQLWIEFPRTFQQTDAQAHPELERGSDSWLHSESVAMVGHHVLLVTAHAAVRAEAERICDSMGLVFDWAANSALAEAQCAQQKPDLLLVDERAMDARMERLQQSLLRADPGFPWIEISKDSPSLSMELWMNESDRRLTLNNLRAQLPQALLLGLSKARAR
jgi:hypothetical protein